MTITVNKLYEKGKHYKMNVLYVHPGSVKDPVSYINVVETSGAGTPSKVEVEGNTENPLRLLGGKIVELVCTEVTEKGPEFALAEKYFVLPAKPKAIKGKNIGKKEGLTVEFKSSLVYKAETSQPDSDQPFEIAKQIAAFMNTNGGDLYMGVDDDGYVVGIEHDLPQLGVARLVMNEKTDAEWNYSANSDGYKRKLTNAVRFYLGDAAPALMDDPVEFVDEDTGLTYFKLHVKPSDEIIYLGRDESVIYRAGPSVVFLRGRQRDQYVKTRFFLKGEKSAAEALNEFRKKNEELQKELKKKNEELEKELAAGGDSKSGGGISVIGTSFVVARESALPLDDKFLAALDKPAGLVYKAGDKVRQKLIPVKTWQEFYEALLGICAEFNPGEFEKLPDLKEFEPQRKGAKTKPNFVRRNSRVRLKSGSEYLGSGKDIRANLAGISRTSFTDPKKLPRRIMAHFGIQPSDIRVWTGQK